MACTTVVLSEATGMRHFPRPDGYDPDDMEVHFKIKKPFSGNSVTVDGNPPQTRRDEQQRRYCDSIGFPSGLVYRFVFVSLIRFKLNLNHFQASWPSTHHQHSYSFYAPQ